jgi:hypothetical protein
MTSLSAFSTQIAITYSFPLFSGKIMFLKNVIPLIPFSTSLVLSVEPSFTITISSNIYDLETDNITCLNCFFFL